MRKLPWSYWSDFVYIAFVIGVTVLGFLLPKLAHSLQLTSISFPASHSE